MRLSEWTRAAVKIAHQSSPFLRSVTDRPKTRLFSSTARTHDRANDHQTFPHHGYYADILQHPVHTVSTAKKANPNSPTEAGRPLTTKEETLARARIVFGSKLAGPAERRQEIERKSQVIAGVTVPPKPEEPDNCCMSGCVNCVWDLYREDLEEWAAKSTEAQQKLIETGTSGQATGMMTAEKDMPTHAAVSVDDDGGGSETNWAGGASVAPAASGGSYGTGDIFADIPVGIREFMKTEKKLKSRRAQQKTTAG